jgi:hypothetical protein
MLQCISEHGRLLIFLLFSFSIFTCLYVREKMVGGVKFGLSFEFYFKNVLHNIID